MKDTAKAIRIVSAVMAVTAVLAVIFCMAGFIMSIYFTEHKDDFSGAITEEQKLIMEEMNVDFNAEMEKSYARMDDMRLFAGFAVIASLWQIICAAAGLAASNGKSVNAALALGVIYTVLGAAAFLWCLCLRFINICLYFIALPAVYTYLVYCLKKKIKECHENR